MIQSRELHTQPTQFYQKYECKWKKEIDNHLLDFKWPLNSTNSIETHVSFILIRKRKRTQHLQYTVVTSIETKRNKYLHFSFSIFKQTSGVGTMVWKSRGDGIRHWRSDFVGESGRIRNDSSRGGGRRFVAGAKVVVMVVGLSGGARGERRRSFDGVCGGAIGCSSRWLWNG